MSTYIKNLIEKELGTAYQTGIFEFLALADRGGLVIVQFPRVLSISKHLVLSSELQLVGSVFSTYKIMTHSRLPGREIIISNQCQELISLDLSKGGYPYHVVGLVNGSQVEGMLARNKLREVAHTVYNTFNNFRKIDNPILKDDKAISSESIYSFESQILNKLQQLTPDITLATVLDDEGFVIAVGKGGNLSIAEELASVLSIPFTKAERLLNQLNSGMLFELSLTGENGCAIIRRTPIEKVLLAVLSSNNHDIGIIIKSIELLLPNLEELAEKSGKLWGVKKRRRKVLERIWNSWETGGKLLPQGKFVRSATSKMFHLPDCRLALKIQDKKVRWIKSRSEALERGYKPCPKCGA